MKGDNLEFHKHTPMEGESELSGEEPQEMSLVSDFYAHAGQPHGRWTFPTVLCKKRGAFPQYDQYLWESLHVMRTLEACTTV